MDHAILILYRIGRNLQAGDFVRLNDQLTEGITEILEPPVPVGFDGQACFGWIAVGAWTARDGAEVYGGCELEPDTLYRVETKA